MVPVYILDEEDDPWRAGAAARWWLHQALLDLSRGLKKTGASLILRRGDAAHILREIVKETGADCVMFSRRYEPFARKQEERVEKAMNDIGVDVQSFNASLLFEPLDIRTKTDGPFKVFTPFTKACLAASDSVISPLPAPAKITGVSGLQCDDLEEWNLQPVHPDWAKNIARKWKASADAAAEMLCDFVEQDMADYKELRDRPDKDGTSRLSPYLASGQIGPRQVWHAVNSAMLQEKGLMRGAECYVKELLWREFAYHQLFNNPRLPEKPLQSQFSTFQWRKDVKGIRAWQKGLTGYPIVDAGMRQLWQEGWMHNRVRMIVASFLIKDLLIPWQEGERWFWDTLVDADLASNAASWQWVAGCGADAAPYFRVFNPVLQGKKFDPDGNYVRRYVPELKNIMGPAIHAPWLLTIENLENYGVTLGESYPKPVVEHGFARERALMVLKAMKET